MFVCSPPAAISQANQPSYQAVEIKVAAIPRRNPSHRLCISSGIRMYDIGIAQRLRFDSSPDNSKCSCVAADRVLQYSAIDLLSRYTEYTSP